MEILARNSCIVLWFKGGRLFAVCRLCIYRHFFWRLWPTFKCWFNLHKVWRSTQSCFITWPQLTFEEIFVMFFVLDFGILHLLSQNIIPQTKPTCDQFLFQWGIHFVLCSISLWILMVIRYPPFCPLKIYVFLFQRKSDFALYTEALKFFDHKENMVRIAVRTLTLNVYKGEWMGCQRSWCYR